MAAHAAAMTEGLLTTVEDVGMFEDEIRSVTLVATRLNIVFPIQWPQPELISSVGLRNGGRRHAVPIVARRAAEALRVMNLQEFLGRMADKDLFANILLRNRNGLADAKVTGFAAIY